MRSIDADGKGEAGEESHACSTTTRVDFGTAYEEALLLVGGEGRNWVWVRSGFS